MSGNVHPPALGFAKFCTTTRCLVFRNSAMQLWGSMMRNRRWNSLALTLAVAAMTMSHLLAAPAAESSPAQHFVFTLGAAGGISAAAASINNLGWIAGGKFTSATAEPAELWVGAPSHLGTLGGPNRALAWTNQNTNGQTVGICETAEGNALGEDWSCALANFPTIANHICHGFLWRDGAMRALLPWPGGLNSYAAAVNNGGQAVGPTGVG